MYCFGSFFSTNQSNLDIGCLCSAYREHSLSLKCIWPSEQFNFDVVSKKLNRYMYFSVAKNEADVIKCYLEVLVKLPLIGVVDIGKSLLHMHTEYNHTQSYRSRGLLLSSDVKGIHKFFNAYCRRLRPETFVYFYKEFSPNVDYYPVNLKIINQHYLEYLNKQFDKQ